jgi:Na+/proline symporter
MAIRDVREVRRASVIGIVWVFLALAGSLSMGIVGALIFKVPLHDPDQIMPLMAKLLPPVQEGILIAAAVAAMMSTVDSQVIIAVGAIERDLLEKLFGVRLSPRTAVLLARSVVVILGGLGILIALSRQNVFEKVLDAWGGLGAGLGPAILLTVLWRGAHRTGILAGMVTGVLVVEFWGVISPTLPWPSLGALVPAFVLNLLVAVAVSLAKRTR